MHTELHALYQYVQYVHVNLRLTSPPAIFYVCTLTLPVCIIYTNTLTTSTPDNYPATRRFHGPHYTRISVYPYPLQPAYFRVSVPFESILAHAPILAALLSETAWTWTSRAGHAWSRGGREELSVPCLY
jgi:hypothetical protein